jgi:hypothetical protein
MVEKVKVDLKRVLSALDKRTPNWYDTLSSEEQQSIGIYQIMRFMSSCKSNIPDIRDHYLTMVNELVNVNYNLLSKHPDIQFRLLQLTGVGTTQYHEWIAPGKRQKNSQVKEWLTSIMVECNDDEIDLFHDMHTQDELKEMARDYGLQDNEVKALFKK